MRKFHFALIGAASIALAACGSQQEDTLDENVGEDLEANELNALADDAAMDAQQEMNALETQQEQLQAEPAAETSPAPPENAVVTEHSEVDDEPLGL